MPYPEWFREPVDAYVYPGLWRKEHDFVVDTAPELRSSLQHWADGVALATTFGNDSLGTRFHEWSNPEEMPDFWGVAWGAVRLPIGTDTLGRSTGRHCPEVDWAVTDDRDSDGLPEAWRDNTYERPPQTVILSDTLALSCWRSGTEGLVGEDGQSAIAVALAACKRDPDTDAVTASPTPTKLIQDSQRGWEQMWNSQIALARTGPNSALLVYTDARQWPDWPEQQMSTFGGNTDPSVMWPGTSDIEAYVQHVVYARPVTVDPDSLAISIGARQVVFAQPISGMYLQREDPYSAPNSYNQIWFEGHLEVLGAFGFSGGSTAAVIAWHPWNSLSLAEGDPWHDPFHPNMYIRVHLARMTSDGTVTNPEGLEGGQGTQDLGWTNYLNFEFPDLVPEIARYYQGWIHIANITPYGGAGEGSGDPNVFMDSVFYHFDSEFDRDNDVGVCAWTSLYHSRYFQPDVGATANYVERRWNVVRVTAGGHSGPYIAHANPFFTNASGQQQNTDYGTKLARKVGSSEVLLTWLRYNRQDDSLYRYVQGYMTDQFGFVEQELSSPIYTAVFARMLSAGGAGEEYPLLWQQMMGKMLPPAFGDAPAESDIPGPSEPTRWDDYGIGHRTRIDAADRSYVGLTGSLTSQHKTGYDVAYFDECTLTVLTGSGYRCNKHHDHNFNLISCMPLYDCCWFPPLRLMDRDDEQWPTAAETPRIAGENNNPTSAQQSIRPYLFKNTYW